MSKYQVRNGQLVKLSDHEGSKKVVTKDQRKKARKAERQNKLKARRK